MPEPWTNEDGRPCTRAELREHIAHFRDLRTETPEEIAQVSQCLRSLRAQLERTRA